MGEKLVLSSLMNGFVRIMLSLLCVACSNVCEGNSALLEEAYYEGIDVDYII